MLKVCRGEKELDLLVLLRIWTHGGKTLPVVAWSFHLELACLWAERKQ